MTRDDAMKAADVFATISMTVLALTVVIVTSPAPPQQLGVPHTAAPAALQTTALREVPREERTKRSHAHALERTPEDWKALSEEKKRAFILRNYGAAALSPPPASPLPSAPTVASPSTERRREHSHATQQTPENWKSLKEEIKRAYIRHNYGRHASSLALPPPPPDY